MSPKLRIGIVGCGRIFRKHQEALLKLQDRTEVVGLCDNNTAKLEAAQASFVNAIGYSSFSEMLKNRSIDAMAICTPSWLHTDMTFEALRANKHVLSEKPLGLSIESIKQVVSYAKQKDLLLAVVFQNRANPPIRFLKEALDQSKLGKVLSVVATMRWYRPQSYYNDGWHGLKAKEGGMLFNQAIHFVDIMLYLTKKRPHKVHCMSSTLCHDIETDDAAIISIQFEDGTMGLIEASTIAYPQDVEGSITLLCERGNVKIGGKALDKIEYWHGEGAPDDFVGESQNDIYGSGHKVIWENMVDAVTACAPLISGGEEALSSLELIDMAYLSSHKGETVFMS